MTSTHVYEQLPTVSWTHVKNTDDFKDSEYTEYTQAAGCGAYFPSNFIMHNIIWTWECQPAVPKHAAPLAATILIFGSANMVQASATAEAGIETAYFLG